jgi:hypothetical protein
VKTTRADPKRPGPKTCLEDNTESSGNPAKTQTFSSKEGAPPPKLTITFG